MILTEVFVPSVSKKYAFQLDEKSKISVVIEEIAELICQKEQCEFVGNKGELSLCVYRDNAILDNQKTLQDYGVDDGERLILL